MIAGELRNKIDGVWNAFWSGGISNPLEVIEQITNLLFIQRLDHEQRLKERTARVTKEPVKDSIFAPDEQGLRWTEFKMLDPETMYQRVADEVFPFVRRLGGDGSTYSEFMGDARFTIQSPALLDKVVGLLDAIPRDKPDTNGDLYEYLLSKLSTSGVNGQFRTPRHIIDLMVRMTAPQSGDTICDPACGTAGFLVSAAEYVRDKYPSVGTDAGQRQHFHRHMFHGYDFDSTMLRIGSMNMLQHGITAPDIRYRDSLSEGASEDTGRYTLILANPPFAGSLDYESTSKDLQQVVKTKKTELLFLALFLRLLEPGGRAAVIVPDGMLSGSSKAHRGLRRVLVEEQKLDAVVKLPSGVFLPYAGVSTAILFFTKTEDGGTDDVWFYDVRADGFSLDDKRNPCEANDLPDVLDRWSRRKMAERERVRTEQSFVVPKAAIAAEGYNLSMDRYSASSVGTIEHRAPIEIVEEIKKEQRSTADSLTSLRSIFSGAGAKVLDRRRVVLGDIISGIDTGRSPVCEARAAEENEWGVLKLGSVTYGAFRPDENKAYLGDVEKMQSNEVRAGDVLMTRKNTRELVGAVALVGEVRPRLLLPDLIFRLHLDLDRIDSRFFQALMMHPVKRLEVRRLAGGSAGSMPNISMARLLKLSIEIPSIEAQRKIADHLAATESYRARLQQVLQATDELYESQRDMAFRGEL